MNADALSFSKRLQTILYANLDLKKRADGLMALFEDVLKGKESLQEFFNNLPEVLQQIFGTPGSTEACWLDLATDYYEKEKLATLLAPDSALLRILITFHTKRVYLLEWPITDLPPPTRQAFQDGNFNQVPAVYAGKYDPSPVTRVLYLTMYDYFMFHFVNYPLRDTSKIKLPEKRSESSEFKRDSRNPNLEKMHVYQFLLLYYLEVFVSICPTGGGITGSSGFVDFQDAEFQRSLPVDGEQLASNFIQLCSEFWLNQTPLGAVYTVPTVLTVECSRLLIIHLLKCIPAFREAVASSPANVSRSARMQNLERFAWQQLIIMRRNMYFFVSSAFEYVYWASRTMRTLRKIVQLWLAFIAPWLLDPIEMSTDSVLKHSTPKAGTSSSPTPKTPSSPQHLANRVIGVLQRSPSFRRFGDKELPSTPISSSSSGLPPWVEQYQKSYMANMFPLYTPLMAAFLNLARRFSFQQVDDLEALSSVVEVWKDLHKSTAMKELEEEWERSASSTAGGWMRDKSLFIRQIQEALIFTEPTLHGAQISSNVAANMKVGALNKYCLQKPSEPPLYCTMFRSYYLCWAPHDMEPSTAAKYDRSQLAKHEHVLTTICDILEVPNRGANLRATRDSAQEPQGHLDELSGQPETVSPDSPFLSSRGRLQVRHGLRRCTNIDTPFFGNERHRPVASYEVATLVRLFYRLSVFIEKQTGRYIDLRFLATHTSVAVGIAILFFVHLFMFIFGLGKLHPAYWLYKIVMFVLWIILEALGVRSL